MSTDTATRRVPRRKVKKATPPVGVVYLIHFDAPLGNEKHQAQHYIGWCHDEKELDARIAQHRNGTGAAILRACVERGINFDVVWTTPGTRQDERRIKNLKNAKFLCPHCREQARAARTEAQRKRRAA